jgi:hypothetical protein
MIPLSISFLKSQPTVGELRKVVMEAQSPIKLQSEITRGDKFVASESNTSLMPRTFNYTKKQEAINNLEAPKVLKDLGIEVL